MFKYLRISITDRCNFRCIYCMPEEGIKKESHEDILRYEEMIHIVKAAVGYGVEQVRLTGGEPLVRAGICDFIKDLSAIEGIKDLALTTNGSLLPKMAPDLKKSGLHRVNISIDSLNADRFKKITRLGELNNVLEGIDAAIDAGLKPVKLNVVLIPGMNDDEIEAFADFAYKKPVTIRFIEKMPFDCGEGKDAFISQEEVRRRIEKKYVLIQRDKETYGPSTEYQLKGGLGGIGLISSRTKPFCSECRRLRLTATGYLLPCLDSEIGVRVKGRNSEEILHVLKKLSEEKRSWNKNRASYCNTFDNSLSKIGG